MISALETLADLPGVRMVMFASEDGVPIAVPGRDKPTSVDGGMGSDEAMAALTAGWLSELTRHVGQLSWNRPRRAVLRAARGTLVVQRTASAVLLVVLAPGLEPEVVRLAMDGTAARIDRSTRSRDAVKRAGGESSDSAADKQEPRSALPSRPDPSTEVSRFPSKHETQDTEDPSGN